MIKKIAINGFGRIGRNVLRALVESNVNDLDVVAINDLAPVSMQAHLFKNDSVHGRFSGDVTYGENWIDVGFGRVRCTSERDPGRLKWSDVDIVLECTGLFTSRDQAARHLGNGASKVLLSAPGANADKTIVYGINHQTLTSTDVIVSNASCTTNCLSPVAHVLDESFGIIKGYMTTIHSYTGDQPTLDAPHSDPYRARAAALSMIPTSTGAAKAIGLVLPALAGKLDGSAIRVPTPNVSAVDLTFQSAQPVTVDEINSALQYASQTSLRGILEVSDEPLVSIDFNHNAHSSIVASKQTSVIGGDFVRVLSWYDNEWAFSNRMLETASYMSQLSAGRVSGVNCDSPEP